MRAEIYLLIDLLSTCISRNSWSVSPLRIYSSFIFTEGCIVLELHIHWRLHRSSIMFTSDEVQCVRRETYPGELLSCKVPTTIDVHIDVDVDVALDDCL